MPRAANQQLRERALALAVSRTEQRAALLGEEAPRAAPVVRAARPMVWGTNNYRNLWAAAMQLGERQEAEGADAAEVSARARWRAR